MLLKLLLWVELAHADNLFAVHDAAVLSADPSGEGDSSELQFGQIVSADLFGVWARGTSLPPAAAHICAGRAYSGRPSAIAVGF